MAKFIKKMNGNLITTERSARLSFLKERAIKTLFFCTASLAVVVVSFILLFLLRDGYPIFVEVGIIPFLFGDTWAPTAGEPLYGILPLIVGTLLVTIGAIVFAVPLSIGCAIYVSELASPRVKSVLKPAIELLAGIPSVVYGFFGLIVLTDFIRVTFDVPTGETWLAASILLGIMALPTIISVSEDAISAVPREFREGSLAVGATRWQTISRVIVPAALSGIAAAIILGIGRAIGETMAVMMVAGNAAVIPDPIWNVLSPIRTLTATLGIEMGEVSVGSEHYSALFGIAVVLLIITLIINLSAVAILRRLKEGQYTHSGRKPLIPASVQEPFKRIAKVILVAALIVFLFIAAPWYHRCSDTPRTGCMVLREGPALKKAHRDDLVWFYWCSGIHRACYPRYYPWVYHHQRAACTLVGIPDPATKRSRAGRGYLPCNYRYTLPGCRCHPHRASPWCGCRNLPCRIYTGRTHHPPHQEWC